METTLTKRGQIVLPAEIRKKHNFKDGDKFVWIDDGNTIKLIPIPDDPLAALRGRGKGDGLSTKLLEERSKDRERELK